MAALSHPAARFQAAGLGNCPQLITGRHGKSTPVTAEQPDGDDDSELSAAERRRRRRELLEHLRMTTSWRDRLLARRFKYIRAHRDLARHLSVLDSGLPPPSHPAAGERRDARHD